MIESNSNKMIWTIGAIIVGSLLITSLKTTMPITFNNVGYGLQTTLKSSPTIPIPSSQTGFTFNYNHDGTAILTGMQPGQEITDPQIPESITNNGQTYTVTEIGYAAFRLKGLTSVTIPDTVTTIDQRAFFQNQITSLTLPNSVTSIGIDAFNSNELSQIQLPKSLTTLDSGAFANNRLTTVTLPNSLDTITGWAFQNNQLTAISIPFTIKSIGGYAFYQNKLTTLSIPNSVVTIGDRAFKQNNLTSLTIPNSVMTIATSAFGDNASLSTANVPQALQSQVNTNNVFDSYNTFVKYF